MPSTTTVAANEDRVGAPERTLRIDPLKMGYKPDLNYDSIESLIEYGEGEQHR
jgi:hypothetical protein